MRTKIGMAFAKLGIPANWWTLLIIVPAFAALAMLLAGNFLFAGALFAAAIAIDSIDGAVARVTRKVTPKGFFLDGVVSTYAEAFALFGLMFAGLPALAIPAWTWAAVLLFASMFMEYSSLLAKHKGLIKKDWTHLYTKPARSMLLLIAIFSAAFAPALATNVIAAAAVLSLIAVFNRQARALFDNA